MHGSRLRSMAMSILLSASALSCVGDSAESAGDGPSVQMRDSGSDSADDSQSTCRVAFQCGRDEARPARRVQPISYTLEPLAPHVPGHLGSVAHDINESGVLTGIVTRISPLEGGQVQHSYRFGPDTEYESLALESASFFGMALNADGDVAGWSYNPAAQDGIWNSATVANKSAIVDVGAKYGAGATRAFDINRDGQLAGGCSVEGIDHVCRYTPGAGWRVLGARGVATSIDERGALVGSDGGVASNAFIWEEHLGFRDLGIPDYHHAYGVAMSSSGRWGGFHRLIWQTTDVGQGALRDLKSNEIRRIEDADDHPWRDLSLHLSDVNDSGWAVGYTNNEVGHWVAFVYDPRLGRTFELQDLIDNASGWHVFDALGISDTGHIAASAVAADGSASAVRLEPTSWPQVEERQLPDVEHEAAYTVHPLELEPAGTLPARSSIAVGLTADHRLLAHVDEADHGIVGWFHRAAWLHPDGDVIPIGAPGDAVPMRVTAAGSQVGTVRYYDSQSGAFRYRAALGERDAIAALDAPPQDAESFGYATNMDGQVLAECVTDNGVHACMYSPNSGWSTLFEGRAFDLSADGTVVGATAADAVMWKDGQVRRLGMGPGSRALTVSERGRFVAGDSGNAFIYDTQRGLVDWLPDLYGDPATIGRVEPHFVSDDGVVVGVAFDSFGRPFAFQYVSETGEFRRLEDLLDGRWRLVDARNMSRDGWISATALREDGAYMAVALEPNQ